jgi:N-acylglucosamine-6-phosphate 2-epimerase
MELREALRGRLIVSVQAEAGSLLGEPATIALLARCVVGNGAAAVRIEGAERIRAVRAAVTVPIVGIIKRPHPGFAPYITSTLEEVRAVAEAGADIVAFDATARTRAGNASVADLIAAIHGHGLAAMADCATLADGTKAGGAAADIVATTLAGYTEETAGQSLPALELVKALAARHPYVVCEGGIGAPDDVCAAFAAGAAAVVVGTAITNVDALTRRFAQAVPGANAPAARPT